MSQTADAKEKAAIPSYVVHLSLFQTHHVSLLQILYRRTPKRAIETFYAVHEEVVPVMADL